MRGRCGFLMVDQWDWEDPSEAPPLESPRFGIALYSPSPCGGHDIISNIRFKTSDFENPSCCATIQKCFYV